VHPSVDACCSSPATAIRVRYAAGLFLRSEPWKFVPSPSVPPFFVGNSSGSPTPQSSAVDGEMFIRHQACVWSITCRKKVWASAWFQSRSRFFVNTVGVQTAISMPTNQRNKMLESSCSSTAAYCESNRQSAAAALAAAPADRCAAADLRIHAGRSPATSPAEPYPPVCGGPATDGPSAHAARATRNLTRVGLTIISTHYADRGSTGSTRRRSLEPSCSASRTVPVLNATLFRTMAGWNSKAG
jgi:hypothetical protein